MDRAECWYFCQRFHPVDQDTRSIERLLRHFGFVNVSSFSFSIAHTWTIDSIVGYLYSTSHCSRYALGENAASFERDVRHALDRCDSSGTFSDTLTFGYTYGRKG